MADDITKKYLDEEGLKTYDTEIKKYALEKTSIEYNKEFTSPDRNSGVVLLTIPMPEESDQVSSLVTIDLRMGLSNWVRYGKLVIMQRNNLVVSKIYGTTNELVLHIKYDWVELDKTLYVKISSWNQLLLHVQASKNVGNITFEENSSKELDNPETPISVLQDELTELQNQINTLSGVVGGDSANFTPNKVLVASTDGKTITTNTDITVDELNCLNGVTTNLKNAAHITEGTLNSDRLPTVLVSKGGTGKTSHTTNAILTGNGNKAVNNVTTQSGAFYATDTNSAPTFGTLPVAQGGTGVSNLGSEGAVLLAGTDGNQIKTACADYFGGAFYCSQGSNTPQFGTLPIAYGGTGALNADRARSNLGIITGTIQGNLDENSATEITLPTSARFCIATICGCHKNATSLLQQSSDVMHHTEKLHLSISYNSSGKRVIIIKPHLDQKDAIPGYYVLVNYLYIDE